MTGEQRSPRDRVINEVLRNYGHVNARGMGIPRKMMPVVRWHASGNDQHFAVTSNALAVILSRATETII